MDRKKTTSILIILIVGILALSGMDVAAVTSEYMNNHPPETPTINGPTQGKVGNSYPYTFNSTDPDGDNISYYVDWGDNTTTGWLELVASDTPQTISHTWYKKRVFTIKAAVKDIHGDCSDWATLEVTMPKSKQSTTFPWIHWFLERFPRMFPILRHFPGL